SGDINPPSVSPTSDTNLYQAIGVAHGNSPISGYPADYDLEQYASVPGSAFGVGYAARRLTAGAEDPGNFTNASAPWRAHSVALRGGVQRPASITPFATKAPSLVFVRGDNLNVAGQTRWTDATEFVDAQSLGFGSASK